MLLLDLIFQVLVFPDVIYFPDYFAHKQLLGKKANKNVANPNQSSMQTSHCT